MNTFQLLSTCFRSILRNRMRSLLTSLGIIIGVGSVIIMVALGEGSREAIEEQINSMGTNLLQVMPWRGMNRGGRNVRFRMNALTNNDLNKIKNESSFTAAVSGGVYTNSSAVGPEGSSDTSIGGVEPGYFVIRSWKTEMGYLFEEEDMGGRNKIAVLGKTTAENLFGEAAAALDRQIRIGTNYFVIIGILESKGGGFGGDDQDDVILVPLDTAQYRINNSGNVDTIFVSVADKKYMDAAQKEMELILRESRKIAEGAESDFRFFNQTELLDMASAASKTLTTLLAAIAGVSLLVGGIGIMNIMLVSVTERTREIGIRMAVGGRKRDILFQFLSESVILSLMGGFLGIALAFLVCRLLSTFNIPVSINPLIVAGSAVFAALVGVAFGYYPALKAARLYPIDALRYE